MKATLQRLFCLWWVVALAFQADAGRGLNELRTDPTSGVEVEVSTVFDSFPQRGAVPMRVRIANGTRLDGRWQWELSGRVPPLLVTRGVFEVPAGQTGTFFIAPMSETSYLGPRFRLSGPGVIAEQANLRIVGRDAIPSRFWMLSHSLTERFAKREKRHRSQNDFEFSSFDPAELPEDWRGLIGVDWLTMTKTEWAELSPAIRDALRRWVAWGGELVLCAFDPFSPSGWAPTFPAVSAAGPHAYGAGHFRTLGWENFQAPYDTLRTLLASRKPVLRAEVPADWAPFKRLNTLKTPSLFIALFVVAFALLIGPVNLFCFAPAGRRHRLFVTTPLLSLGGTVILLLAICVIDGIGGTGSRWTIIELFPDAEEMLVRQDQVVRTGLLLSSRFTLKEEAFLHAFKVHGRSPASLKIAGNRYSGDWFRSRTVQAHQLAAIRHGRLAVTQVGVTPSGAPVVVSGLETALEALVFCAADGSLWRGEMIRKGEETTLEPIAESERPDWTRWWKEAASGAPNCEARFGKTPVFVPGVFYATLADTAGQPVETLGSIRWKEERVALFGPMEGDPQ